MRSARLRSGSGCAWSARSWDSPRSVALIGRLCHHSRSPATLTVRHQSMPTLLEYVGTVHIIMGVYRGNPIALYLTRTDSGCKISPQVYPWNEVVGTGETPNKAAAAFEENWKKKGLGPDMYTGPHWEGGIKPE